MQRVRNPNERRFTPIKLLGLFSVSLGVGGMFTIRKKISISSMPLLTHIFPISCNLLNFDTCCSLFYIDSHDSYNQLQIERPDPSSQFKLAIGSYVEQYSNVVSIIKKNPASDEGSLYKAAEFEHPYPCTVSSQCLFGSG